MNQTQDRAYSLRCSPHDWKCCSAAQVCRTSRRDVRINVASFGWYYQRLEARFQGELDTNFCLPKNLLDRPTDHMCRR